VIYSTTSIIVYSVLIISSAIIAFRVYKKSKVDKKFNCKVSGGRGGVITIAIDGRYAKCEYEVGSKVDFIIYESSLKWWDGKELEPEEKDKLKSALMNWSSARRSSIEFGKDT